MPSSELAWARERYPWHLAVWENDVVTLEKLIKDPVVSALPVGKKGHIDELDLRGNAPLHLAIMLNRQECLRMLLEHGNPDCRLKNSEGWSPLAEAISLANVDLLRYVYLKRIEQSRRILQEQLPSLFENLAKLPDFTIEMHWEFRSWIPFLSKLCPTDVNTIYKRGSSVRLDTTIAGFERMKWVRGNISFMMLGPQQNDVLSLKQRSVSELKAFLTDRGFSHQDCIEKPDLLSKAMRVKSAEMTLHNSVTGKLVMVRHDQKQYMTITDDPDSFEEFESMMNIMMTQPKTTSELNRINFTCRPVRGGFLGWGAEKVEQIGDFPARVYEAQGIRFVTKVRTEHIEGGESDAGAAGSSSSRRESDDGGDSDGENDVNWEEEARKMEEALQENKQLGGSMPEHTNHSSRSGSASMPLGPPPPTAVTPEAYFDLSSGPIGPLGRPQRVKSKSRTFKGKMWMSDEYPIALKDILPVLQTLERSSVVFSKLTETLSLDLPPGFPVQFEVPVLPILSVLVTFRKYDAEVPQESLFKVPMSYTSVSQQDAGRGLS